MARIPLITSTGGCTCKTPAFTVHGPNPSTSLRSRTAIVKSWCQTTFQFELRVLLKKIPLPQNHFGQSQFLLIHRPGSDIANPEHLERVRKFLRGARKSP